MALIIDGYNLLNAVGITAPGRRGSSLERSRAALLGFLADALGPREAGSTTVVFDAKAAPPGLPRVVEHAGLTVRFAAGYDEADTLIEELVRADTSPKRLTVVSSDHRLHRAARRRKARAVDSDVWFRELIAERARRRTGPAAPARPTLPLDEAEVLRWLEEFGGQAMFEKLIAEQAAGAPEPPTESTPTESGPADKLTAEEAAEIGNPFPPGYAEDLLAEPPDDPESPSSPGKGDDLPP